MTQQAVEIIEAIAERYGLKERTRIKWLTRRKVPHPWRLLILEEARRLGASIDPAIFDNFWRPRAKSAVKRVSFDLNTLSPPKPPPIGKARPAPKRKAKAKATKAKAKAKAKAELAPKPELAPEAKHAAPARHRKMALA